MTEKRKISKGQIIIGALTIVGSVLVAMVSAWGTVSSKTADIDKKVSIVEERENNHYLEVMKKTESIEKKLDLIIEKQTLKR